jgi:hypothetical protein
MNAIKAVLVGAAAAGVFLSGAQVAAANPAPTAVSTEASTEASASVSGEVVAVVGKRAIKVKVDANTVVDVDLDLKTIISGEVKVGVKVNVNGKKIAAKILASAVVVIK